MISIPLMRVVVDAVLFLELNDDNVIQPDAAVTQLESIAASLQELSEADKNEFLKFCSRLADEEEAAGAETRRIKCLRQLGENLGLC